MSWLPRFHSYNRSWLVHDIRDKLLLCDSHVSVEKRVNIMVIFHTLDTYTTHTHTHIHTHLYISPASKPVA